MVFGAKVKKKFCDYKQLNKSYFFLCIFLIIKKIIKKNINKIKEISGLKNSKEM